MLALLGWNPGTEKELFSLEELIAAFSLDRVSKSGAKFSPDKTNWFNQQYLQKTSSADITALFLPILQAKGITADSSFVEKVVSLVKERAVFVKDLWDLSDFFFVNPSEFDEKATKKQWKPFTADLLRKVMAVLQNIEDFSSENTENILKEWISSQEIGFGKVMQPLRLSLVGGLKGPHLFDIIALIGKENALARIEKAIDTLG
jgi:glutamyl-tRNA synthetase